MPVVLPSFARPCTLPARARRPPPRRTCLARFDGGDITRWSPDRITRRGLVRTFQIARGFPRLSVRENLMLYGARQPGEILWKAWARPAEVARREHELSVRAAAVAGRLNLARVLDDPAAALSGGQKKL